ncbi:MAG: type II secretion system F family protein [Pirellulales bacterium]|nr:type II secretion system F family protein [Pirellulales bacterium]
MEVTGREEKRLSPVAAEALTRAIAGAETCGVPLPEILRALADDLADPRLATTAKYLAEKIHQGATLDEAIASIAQRLPNGTRCLVSAGAHTGQLAEILESYCQQQVVRKEISQTIWSAIAYPMFIAILFVPILLLFTVWIVPMFDSLFQDWNVELPKITASVIKISRDVPLLLAVLLGVPAGTVLVIKLFGLKRLDHRLRNATPLIGRFWIWASQIELAAMLAIFLKNQLPLPDALERTAMVVHDHNVARTCRWASGQVRSGQGLGAAFADSMHIDPMLTEMIVWGESSSTLPDMLHLAEDMYSARINQRAAFLARLLPLIAMLMIGGFMVAVVLTSLLLPLLSLVRTLAG